MESNLSYTDIYTDCSGLLGRTSLRHHDLERVCQIIELLFRPSRPDFIETSMMLGDAVSAVIALFRPSRPDFIETLE